MQMTKSMHLSTKSWAIPTAQERSTDTSFNSTSSSMAPPKSKKKKATAAASLNSPKDAAANGDGSSDMTDPDHNDIVTSANVTTTDADSGTPITATPENTQSSATAQTSSARKKKKKKSKSKNSNDMTTANDSHWHVNTHIFNAAPTDEIWSNNANKREKIREFWLQLSDEDRRALIRFEKETVLRRLKEPAKASGNCSVCNKSKSIIETELTKAHNYYYETLQQPASQQQTDMYSNLSDKHLMNGSCEPCNGIHRNSNEDTEHHEWEDDDDDSHSHSDQSETPSDDLSSNGGCEQCSTEEYNHSTECFIRKLPFLYKIQDNMIMLADEFMKDDGRMFLDMLDTLDEHRKNKSAELQHADDHSEGMEEEEDDDQDDDEEHKDAVQVNDAEKMALIPLFITSLIERRVYEAYLNKVALERQSRLIQELDEEDRQRQEREQRKRQEKELKRDKKRQAKKQQEEERLAKEAQRKAEEEAAKAERERKLDMERQKREQERLRKEEERRQREEERARKNEEKRRKLKEERERAAEKERKRKEKEEEERREREEKEQQERRREQEQREREQHEKEQREQEQRERQQQEGNERAAKQKAEETCKKSNEQTEPLPQPETAVTAPSLTEQQHPKTSPGPSAAVNPVDEAARQKSLMDALIGSPTDHKRVSVDPMPAASDMLPPHPLFPSNGFSKIDTTPLGRVLEPEGMMVTSPVRDFSPPITADRGMLPIGFGRLSSSFDTGIPTKVGSRPGNTVPPIGQPSTGRRTSTTAGPIGSPVVSRLPKANTEDNSGSMARSGMVANGTHSYFSNFLFGTPGRGIVLPRRDHDIRIDRLQMERPTERRFSLESAGFGWTNGWTASAALSDNVHGKLFGDVLADRNTTLLERARIAYRKLDVIAQAKYIANPPQFHTLAQLHRMMCDTFFDIQVDIRELYQVISAPASGFQCINHTQHGYIVRYDGGPGERVASVNPGLLGVPSGVNIGPRPIPSIPPIHPQPQHPLNHPPPHLTPPSAQRSTQPLPLGSTHPVQQLKGNPQLFGGMS